MKMTLFMPLLLLRASLHAEALNVSCACAGRRHSCIISGVGDVVCWGEGALGSLGYGSPADFDSPSAALAAHPGGVQLTQNGSVALREIVCSEALTMTLLTDGCAVGFGDNAYGQLGRGHAMRVGDDEVPWQSPGGPVTLSGPARDVACGRYHCCAVLDVPILGRVACWGQAQYGQLGYANTNDIGDNETVASAGFVDVGGSGNASAVFCGGYHTLSLMSNGVLRSWGLNANGQLGLAHTVIVGDNEHPSSQPDVALDLGEGETIAWATAGMYHTCVAGTAGRAKCWGFGWYGRLGTGNENDVKDPSAIGFLDFGVGARAVQIEAYDYHSCAVLATGEVMCFGESAAGRLGCGWACPDRLAPNGTVALNGVVSGLAGGSSEHTIALHPDGQFQAWGGNYHGQLGYGTSGLGANVGDNETTASVGNVNFTDGVFCAEPFTATEMSKSNTATLRTATRATRSQTGITRTPRSRLATVATTTASQLRSLPSATVGAAASSAASSPARSSVLTFVLVGVGALVLLVVLCVAALAVLVVVRGRRRGEEEEEDFEVLSSYTIAREPREKEGEEQHYQPMRTRGDQATEYAQLPHKHKRALIAAGHVIDFAELELGATLGEGQFGVVYRAVWRRAPVAVKELRSFDTKQIAEFEREAELHKRLPPHTNVVQFLAVTSGARLCIVVEFVAGGSLDRRGRLVGKELLGIARGIAAGMAHLHAHEVIHRDLAARNVLLSREGGEPKVTDFGMSRLVVTGEYVTQSNVLPLKWLAPETVQTRAFSKSSDVWSYGVTLFECAVGHAPWPELTGFEVARMVGHEGAVPHVSEESPIASLMRACFERDPAHRPSFVDVVGML